MPCIETREVIWLFFLITLLLAAYGNAESKTEFTNNSINSPKIGKLIIETLIIPQGISIHEKNQSSKISCYCPFKKQLKQKQLVFGKTSSFSSIFSQLFSQIRKQYKILNILIFHMTLFPIKIIYHKIKQKTFFLQIGQ